MAKDQIVAVDLGGTHIRAAHASADGKLSSPVQHNTLADQGPESVLLRIFAAIREIAPDMSVVKSIGLGAPGPLDPWKGVILSAPNLPGVLNLPIKERLEKEFQVPAFIGNEANPGALGEHRYGAG